MRVIAGSARSLLLKTKKGSNTRPTTDKIKETLFNMISADIYDAFVLDLFAGSGAIGIEALSRGAYKAVFIEKDREALRYIKENLKHTRLDDRALVISADVFKALENLSVERAFDVVFIDPPYNKEFEVKVLKVLEKADYINSNTMIIIELSKESELKFDDKIWKCIKTKIYKSNKHIFIKKGDIDECSYISGEF